MNILVTGSEGFIGSHLVPYLEKKGHSVYGLDLVNEFDIFKDAGPYIENAHVIVHLAALTSVSESFEKPAEYLRTNMLGTAHMIQLCAKYKKKFVYASSAAIYHPDSSPYALSKKVAEDLVYDMSESFPTVILRLFNVYGPGMKKSAMAHFLTDDPICVYGGEQTRDFIHIDDVVRIFHQAITSRSWSGVIEVGTGETHSIGQIAEYFAKERGVEVIYFPPESGVLFSCSNSLRLRKLFDGRLRVNIKHEIKKLCSHQ